MRQKEGCKNTSELILHWITTSGHGACTEESLIYLMQYFTAEVELLFAILRHSAIVSVSSYLQQSYYISKTQFFEITKHLYQLNYLCLLSNPWSH